MKTRTLLERHFQGSRTFFFGKWEGEELLVCRWKAWGALPIDIMTFEIEKKISANKLAVN